MVGFANDEERASDSMYAGLVGKYVRVFQQSNVFVGRLDYSDNRKTLLDPYIHGVGTPMGERAVIVKGTPAIIETSSITAMLFIPSGEVYLEEIVRDAEEKTRRDLFMQGKALEEKGYK